MTEVEFSFLIVAFHWFGHSHQGQTPAEVAQTLGCNLRLETGNVILDILGCNDFLLPLASPASIGREICLLKLQGR